MRVLIVAPGSRGDVAPFTGLGSALRNAGHDVTIAGYAMSGGLVTACGLGFRPLPGDPRVLNEARWRQRGKGPAGGARLIRLVADHLRELHAGILAAAQPDADVLLLSGISYAGGFHIGTALGLPSIGLSLQPVYPTRNFPPSIMTHRDLAGSATWPLARSWPAWACRPWRGQSAGRGTTDGLKPWKTGQRSALMSPVIACRLLTRDRPSSARSSRTGRARAGSSE